MAMVVIMLSACKEDAEIAIPQYSARHGNEISIDEARSDLKRLISDIELSDTRSVSERRRISSEFILPIGERTRSGEDQWIYVFNFENNMGYAIMSSDNRVPSLIAYSESGSLDAETVVTDPGLTSFLSGMEDYYAANTVEMDTTFHGISSPEILGPDTRFFDYSPWRTIIYKPNGYCPVKWGQNNPYNKYCPQIGGKKSPACCVATAVAQLMATHKYPDSYDGYQFSWNDMIVASAKGEDQTARLMSLLGQKKFLDVSYGMDSSSADIKNIPRTLSSLGYTESGSFEKYNNDVIINELKSGFPIIVAGHSFKVTKKILGITVSTTYKGGHAWLVHGLMERCRDVTKYNSDGSIASVNTQSEWYVLCNWGWRKDYNLGDYRDGYYLSGAFDTTVGPEYRDNGSPTRSEEEESTDGTSDNFQYNLRVLTGIRK